MSNPLLLDLFCGAGGAGYGYHLAGFDVVGVDSEPQPHYPFEFVQADALAILNDSAFLAQFHALHASPVCKAYTNCNLSPKELHPRQIADVRKKLLATGKMYIIENVMGAKRDMHASLLLCGTMFGLKMKRHRLFETNAHVLMCPPRPCNHKNATIEVYGHSVWDSALPGTRRKDGKPRPDSVPLQVGRDTMEIPWMTTAELAQAIPPAYTKFIGEQLLHALSLTSIATCGTTELDNTVCCSMMQSML